MKRALITGINGQDGSYLAELLLEKGYEVHGLVRATTTAALGNILHLLPRIKLHAGDLGHGGALFQLLHKITPDEVYNLAAQSQVGVSFAHPEYTVDSGTTGIVRLLEAVRSANPACRYYQASSSEMFGKVIASPQNETTPFYPRSPYGASKLFAHWLTKNYREAHGMFCCSGILFNHESPRRGETFVTRKITMAAARIRAGKQDLLVLGNLDARRDWGYAKEYVEAMWLMLQQEVADDFVIATGETHTVREFAARAFERAGLNPWKHITTSDELKRPAEVDLLIGDAAKAERVLGWKPKTKFDDLVDLMVTADVERFKNEQF